MATGIKWNKYFRQLAYGSSSCGYVKFRKPSSYSRLLLLVITSCEPSAYHLCRSMRWKQPLFEALKPAGASMFTSAHCYYGVFDFFFGFVLFFVLEALKSDCEFVENWLRSQVNLQKLWGTACVLFLWGVILTAVLTLLCVITSVKYKWQLCSDWHSCHFHTHIVSTLCNAHAPTDLLVWYGGVIRSIVAILLSRGRRKCCHVQPKLVWSQPHSTLRHSVPLKSDMHQQKQLNSTCRLRGCFQKF